jgi:hypothetical protein
MTAIADWVGVELFLPGLDKLITFIDVCMSKSEQANNQKSHILLSGNEYGLSTAGVVR